jgi:cytoskeleton protein RodZ
MAKGSFGERLKREREMREVSLDELTKATRISQRFLEALENEDWKKLPGGVFGRGFVRTIAGYLGLDEETLLGEYDLARGDLSHNSSSRPEERIPSTPPWVPLLVVLLICAALAGLVFAGWYVWRRYSSHHQTQPSSGLVQAPRDPSVASAISENTVMRNAVPAAIPAAAVPVSGEANVSEAAASIAAPLDLSVSTSVATGVRVVADDKLVFDDELPVGTKRHFGAMDHFAVTAADSSAVLLELNHQVMRPLGPPGASGTMVLSLKDVRQ